MPNEKTLPFSTRNSLVTRTRPVAGTGLAHRFLKSFGFRGLLALMEKKLV